jgi:sugar/nucleoside kinase (ribokinase family)
VIAAAGPELIIVGQVTIDDVVPAEPGAWTRQIGGSSLYAAAGARLWMDPGRIGLVARIGTDYPFDAEALLRAAGVGHVSLRRFEGAHLVEWLIYEPDGSRRSLPRNAELLAVGAEGSASLATYHDKLRQIAPPASEIPRAWLPAAAVHLCPQVGGRHADSLALLRGQAGWISVDPSPHYSRHATVEQLAAQLSGCTAFLPSAQEVQSLLDAAEAHTVALSLHRAGFAEVALKRGATPVVLATAAEVREVPVRPSKAVDPTGAGDAFCGAYAACRLQGLDSFEAARRAALTSALVVQCSGVEAALSLSTPKV